MSDWTDVAAVWVAVGALIGFALIAVRPLIRRWRDHVWERVCWGSHGGVTPKYRARWWVNTCWAFWIVAFWTAHPRSAWRARREAARDR